MINNTSAVTRNSRATPPIKQQQGAPSSPTTSSSSQSSKGSNNELHLYHSRIKNIYQIKTRFPHVNTVECLNLHGNQISKIHHMNDFIYLRELNLSSNEISKMEGLNMLRHLQVLNLSSNRIEEIEGLSELYQLKKLVLSYNRIASLAGLCQIHGANYQIEVIDLRGNRVKSMKEVSHLSGCHKLREVYFQYQKQFANPVCAQQKYTQYLIRKLPALAMLDGVTLKQNLTSSVHLYPGLSKYSDLLEEEISATCSDHTITNELDEQIVNEEEVNEVSEEVHSTHVDSKKHLDYSDSKQMGDHGTQTSIPSDRYEDRWEEDELNYNFDSEISDNDYEMKPLPTEYFNQSVQTDTPTIDRFVPSSDKWTQVAMKINDTEEVKSLQKLLEKAYEDHSLLTSHVEKLCHELGSAKVYIQNRESELAVLSGKRNKFAKLYKEYKQTNEEQALKLCKETEKVEQLKSENEQLREHCNNLKEEISTMKLDLEKVQGQVNIKRVQQQSAFEMSIAKMNDEMEAYKSINSQLKKELHSATEQMKKASDFYKLSKHEMSNAHQAELQSILQRHRTELSSREELYHNKLVEKEKELEQKYRAQIEEIDKTTKVEKKKFEDLDGALRDASATISELKSILKEYMTKDLHLNAKNEENMNIIKRQKNTINEMLEVQNQKNNEISKLRNSFEQQINKLIQQYSKKVPVMEHENSKLKQVIEKQISTIHQLEKSLTENNEQYKEHNKELLSLREKMEQVTKELVLYRSQESDFKQQLTLKDVIIEDNNKAIQEYRQKLNDLKLKDSDRSETSRAIKQELNDYISSNEALEDKIRELEDDMDELKNKVRVGKMKRNELRDVLQQKEKTLEACENQYQQYVSTSQKHMKELESKYIQQLRSAQLLFDNIKSELEKVQLSTEKAKSDRAIALQDTEKLLKLSENLKEKLKLKEQELSSAKRDAQLHQQHSDELQEKLVKLTSAFRSIS